MGKFISFKIANMRFRRLIIYVFLAMVFIMVKPHNAISQTYICGSGPGPGEVMVGTTQGGNGIAPVPICASDDNNAPQGSNYSSKKSGKQIDNYVTCAVHPDAYKPWCGKRFRSAGDAQKAVLAACNADMGSGCKSFEPVKNAVFIVTRNKSNEFCGVVNTEFKYGFIHEEEMADKVCPSANGFKLVWSYFAQPWSENPKYPLFYEIEAPTGFYRIAYAAVANVKIRPKDAEFENHFFVSTGLRNAKEAEDAAINYCKSETKQNCEIALNAVQNGDISFNIDENNQTIIAWGIDYDDAHANSHKECIKQNKRCTSSGTYSVNEEIKNFDFEIRN